MWLQQRSDAFVTYEHLRHPIYTHSQMLSVAYQQKQSVSVLGTDWGIYLTVFI